MIRSVTVTNYLGESLVIELAKPEKSGFNITNISGIGPARADIRLTEITTNDGGLYNSSRLQSRNIVFTIKFMENPTIEKTRHNSYKYFPTKKPVVLLFETDDRQSEIEGYVESNEVEIFVQEEYAQISIICPNPYFRSTKLSGTDVTVFYGVESKFIFPFSNESLTDSLIFMGDIKNESESLIYYSGDAEIGMTIVIDAVGVAEDLTIFNVTTRESMKINTARLEELTGSGIINGDRLIINTTRGEKAITLLRRGVYTNVLNTLDKDSDWFQLSKGDNIFAFSADSGAANLQFRIENQTIYEGV